MTDVSNSQRTSNESRTKHYPTLCLSVCLFVTAGTASEKRFLRERVDMLKNEKFKLDEFISDDVEPQISDLQDEGANQNNMLATIRQRVRILLSRLFIL